MRYFTARINGEHKPGVAMGNKAALFSDLGIEEKSLLAWLQKEEAAPSFREESFQRDLQELVLASPIVHPPHDILCVGKNYMEHIKELRGDLGEEPIRPVPHYFGKRCSEALGPTDAIRGFFSLDAGLDYEVELAAVIGKTGRDIPQDKVWDYLFGFTVLNDMSSRTLQNHHVQWYRGKSLDGYTVIGPWIVDKEAFTRPLKLELTTHVNGELRQKANTEQMIFSLEELVSELSQGITLRPGDMIATGTPSGVGMGFSPPRFLQKGDCVRMEIENIGVLQNLVTDA